MCTSFHTREDAASYYNRNNPHMRPLNSLKTWESDWDPHTNLMYIVRPIEDASNLTIPTFQAVLKMKESLKQTRLTCESN